MAYLPSCCKPILPLPSIIERKLFEKSKERAVKAMATAQKLPQIVNGVKVDDLITTIDAIKVTPSIAKFNFRIENEWTAGSQNRSTLYKFYGASQELSRPSPFVLHPDEPAVLLAKD